MSIRKKRNGKPTGIGRCAMIQLSAAGVAAFGASRTVEVWAAPTQGPGTGQGAQPPQEPSPENVVNPTTLLTDDWTEPWVWRPADWPDAALDLHVVGNAHPARGTSTGNPFTPLFSFSGSSPEPTIRMRGDELLRIKLRNMLPRNFGAVPVGASPNVFELPDGKVQAALCAMLDQDAECELPPSGVPAPILADRFDEFYKYLQVEFIDNALLSTPANALHASHTTNLHTHGLHVEPEMNPNGTAGDNIMLRVIPRADFEYWQQAADPQFRQLGENERVGELDFEHPLGDVQRTQRLGNGSPVQPHPPGTHWYHPHAHGSTHDQVAGGMAGFLVVEGDVDDAINLRMTGRARPDLTEKTGPFDYRERMMMIQRVLVSSFDFDRGPRRNQFRAPTPTAVNGEFAPATIFMRPGAVERWRLLNASVDGRGFKNFMVLEGQFVFNDRQLWRVVAGEDGGERTFEPASRQEVEDAKVGIYQLAFDGITLVSVEGGQARYVIRDLSTQNSGTLNPLDREPEPGEDPTRALLRNVEDCYRDGDSLRNVFVRPNQIFMANANRADVIFKAPADATGKVYTIFAQEFRLQTDNYQQRLQVGIATGASGFARGNPAPVDVVVGYVYVSGEPVEGGDFDVMTLNSVLPEVPSYLQPVENEELRVPADEAARRGVPTGSARTRVVSYSGTGPTDFPLIEVPEAFATANSDLQGLLWEEINGTPVLLAPAFGTMAIHPDFDLAANPNPASAHKFGHSEDDTHPMPLVETAEEWVVYNCSAPLWSPTDAERFPQPGQNLLHYTAYPMTRAEGQARFEVDPEFRITTKGADHPFHIHVNPCWVLRVEVPDEEGRLHNILSEPRWMDTVSIPRDGGRVVFRSRFADYTGKWVNHCHILAHEDQGMMQMVESVPRAEDANYHPRPEPVSTAMSSEEVSTIYPRPSRELMYRQNISFVDTHPLLGQVFPGFDVEVPELDDEEPA